MNEAEQLEKLKSIKRRAKFLDRCCRTLYEDRIKASSSVNKKVFYEAISALDAMHGIYERLKTGMRKEPFTEQIKFAMKWSTYVSCIDTITAYKTLDKYLLRGITLDEPYAREMAPRLYRDYRQQLNNGLK